MKSTLKATTGYSASEWRDKLSTLYNAAKRRHGGNSLSIYGRVSSMFDRLETTRASDVTGFDQMCRDLNDLAGDLRRV